MPCGGLNDRKVDLQALAEVRHYPGTGELPVHALCIVLGN